MKFQLLAALAVTAAPFAIAAADRDHPPKPPPEAFDACAKSARGDRCSVTFNQHTMTGTCEAVPDLSALACRPDHPPGPPAEAVQACASKAENDACSFAHGDHAIAGTCAKGPDASAPLACRPAHPPGHP
ncbi:MAG: hypothetical protein ABI867_05650 [Kofleriaceae bacterium]